MRPGGWVFVCGPSGAGKDSVMAWARQRLLQHPRIVFARRMVTRPVAGEVGQDEVSPSLLQALHAGGNLAWHWEANGLAYGIAGSYAVHVASGSWVVVNGSREHVSALAPSPGLHRVLVTASDTVVRERLQRRAREPEPAIAARLARSAALPALAAECVIENGGEIAAAGTRLSRYLEALAR